MSFQRLTMLFAFATLVGCTSVPIPQPIIIENNEKDLYIKRIEQTVSETASALVAVAPQIPAGIAKELVNSQVERLSAISKPSVQTVEVYKKILLTDDRKALQVQEEKSLKADAELQKIRELVAEKDAEIDLAKIATAEAEAREQRETKNKILWLCSCIGGAIFTAGVFVLAFSPRKTSGVVLMLAGGLAIGSAWIFDSPWFPWIAGAGVGFALLDILVIGITKTYKYLRPSDSTVT